MNIRMRGRVEGPAVLSLLVVVVVMAAIVVLLARQRPLDVWYEGFVFHNAPAAILLAWMGRLVLARRRRHGAGLVLLAIAVVSALHVVVATVADGRLAAAGVEAKEVGAAGGLAPSDLPLDAAIPVWLMSWLWVPGPVLAITMLPLLFPDGNLPGQRWRAVPMAAAAGGGASLMLALSINAWPTATWTAQEAPIVSAILAAAGGLSVLGATVASFAVLTIRWRSADAVRRSQFRVVGIAAGGLAMVAVASYPWQQVWVPAVLVCFNALLVAYGLAVLRYRLHDLEPVLGRAAVAAVLSVLVAVVYLAVVVGIGGLVGRGVESPVLPLAAVGIVALVIEPARRRARRYVDFILYNRRSDRTEVMSQLADRASSSASASEVLTEVAELLVRSTGAARVEAWLFSDAATQPALAASAGAGTNDGAEPVLATGVDNQRERVRELILYARAAADLVPDAPQLLTDVAHALGVVLRNDRLTTHLRVQLDELQASRHRLVEAQEEARRSLERDIHDGAQARLISLRLRLGVMRAELGGGDASVAEELDALGQEVDIAVRSLRDLARGVHPPILEQAGLAAALEAHSRGLPLTVSVSADGLDRYSRPAEGAVYFACMEAVQNTIRHSGATAVAIELWGDDAALSFCVHDDGIGFDPVHTRSGAGLANIDDRVAALGGSTNVDSAPGAGTRVRGEIPVQLRGDER